MKYIVRSGAGYLTGFAQGNPMMTSDPVAASRMARAVAERAVERLARLGFAGELVEVEVVKRVSGLHGLSGQESDKDGHEGHSCRDLRRMVL